MLHDDYGLIVIALLFCAYASYTDLRYGKVPNLCSFGLLYAGMLAQILFLWEGSTSLGYALSVVLLSGVLAFALYWFGIMAPGDAKLFWGVAMVLPPRFFENATGTMLSFPPLVVLVNTLVLYFGFIVTLLFIRTSLKQKQEALTALFAKGQLLKQVFTYILHLLSFIAFGYCAYYLLLQVSSVTGTVLSGLPTIILIIALFSVLKWILKRYMEPLRYWVLALLLIWALGLIYLSAMPIFTYLPTLGTLIAIYLGINLLLKSFVLNLDHLVFSKQISIADLQPGMIPAERILKLNDHYEKEAAVTSSWLRPETLVCPTPEGMSAETIASLQALSYEGHFQSFGNQLMIQRAFHFAPMILFGVLVTILCRGAFFVVF